MDVGSAIKTAAKPNYLISVLVALVILGLINGLLPAEYKMSKIIGGLFA